MFTKKAEPFPMMRLVAERAISFSCELNHSLWLNSEIAVHNSVVQL